jgi:carboxypeptidase family protein
MIHRIWTLAVGVVMLTAASAAAQEFRGTLGGRVLDESGAAIPGVTITATHLDTGVGATTVSNSQGQYVLPQLQPGLYKVAFELQGFRRVERGRVEVRVAEHVDLDVTMKVGQLEQTVTVTARASVLDTTSGSAEEVIDGRRLDMMPLSDGNPFTLIRLAPGIETFGDLRYFRPFDNNATAEFSSSGAPTSNAYTIDGAPNNAHRQGNADSRMAMTPPADAIEEFKIQTAVFDAQQGRSAGATVNVAMKGGTNTYRGGASYYHRDESMAENEYFLKLRGQPEPPLDYARRGFNVGGPVRLGNLYDGRRKTFFFTSWEWLNDKFPDASQQTIPSMKQRQGDFSELLSQNILIYDPATARQSGTRIVRDPFPGNIIPADRISPIAREILKYYPEPNQQGNALGQNNYISGVTRNDDYYTMNFRGDHVISRSQRISARFAHNDRKEQRGNPFGEVNGVRPLGFYMFRINDQLAGDYVWTISNASVLNVRGSWIRFREFDKRQSQDVFDPASLGFSPQTVALFRGYKYFPQMDLANFTDLGTNWLGGVTSQGWAVQPTWSTLKGRHSIKAGYDFRVNREDELFDGHAAGLYTFRGTYTRPQDNSSDQFGQDLASMLLGIATGGQIEQFGDRFNQVFYNAGFVQDDWRVTNRLTLNLGLRYEYETAPTERFNRNVRGFDRTAELTIGPTVAARYAANPIPELPADKFNARGGVRFATSENRQFWIPDKNNFEPRLGAAYRWNDKTVLRGGWGMYVQPTYVLGSRQLGFSSSTGIVPTLDTGLTFRATLFNPFPDGTLADPIGQALGPNTSVGDDLTRFFDDINFKNGNVMRFVAGVQRELPGRLGIQANYVGTKGYDLRTDVQINALPPWLLSTSPVRDDARNSYLTSTSSTGGVPNPLWNLVPGQDLNGQFTSRARLLKPYPMFDSIEGRRYDGSSHYHSLQLSANKRFDHGLSLGTNYTYARGTERVSRLNEGDTEYEKRPTGIPHRFVFNPIWDLPFGKGRAIARNAGRLLDSLIGGWTIAGVYQYQSGAMLGIGNLYYSGDIRQLRTHVPQDLDVLNETTFDTSGFYFWDDAVKDASGNVTAALQRADARKNLASNLRTLPSRVRGFTGTPQSYLDLKVVKRVTLARRVRAEIQAEVYNATNFAWFQNPSLDPTSANFGKVTSTRNLPREVQIGARITF